MKSNTTERDALYEKLVAKAGLYGKAFFGWKSTKEEKAQLEHFWKSTKGQNGKGN